MENSLRIKVTLTEAETFTIVGDGEHRSHVSRRDGTAESLRSLCDTLQELGLDVETEQVNRGRWTLTIDYPTKAEARRFAKRGGSYQKKVPEDSPLCDMKERERYEWLEEHSAKEGAEALGVTERTYFRRMTALRGKYGSGK